MPRWIASLLALLGLGGCAGQGVFYQDTYTPAGIPNFHVFAPGMYRTGVPPSQAAWNELRALVEVPGRPVTKIVLHDASEGDESPATAFGWNVVTIPLVPEADRPLTVFELPDRDDVHQAVQTILDAHARGDVVVWGCQHDRERGGLISALVGIALLHWTDDYAWQYMLDTGSRIEVTPGLLGFWLELTAKVRLRAQP